MALFGGQWEALLLLRGFGRTASASDVLLYKVDGRLRRLRSRSGCILLTLLASTCVIFVCSLVISCVHPIAPHDVLILVQPKARQAMYAAGVVHSSLSFPLHLMSAKPGPCPRPFCTQSRLPASITTTCHSTTPSPSSSPSLHGIPTPPC